MSVLLRVLIRVLFGVAIRLRVPNILQWYSHQSAAARYYKNLAKPSALPNDTNLHLMRYNTYPMWEVRINASAPLMQPMCLPDCFLGY